MDTFTSSDEYNRFRSNISQRRICVDTDDQNTWTLYDAGPRDVNCPLIFLPPVSGQADVYFQQLLALSSVGYRVISIQYPIYWTTAQFCTGFRHLLDHLRLDKVHLFGASLGGFLAQKFTERTRVSPRVQSLILCNTFNDSASFHRNNKVSTFWMTPSVLLKKLVIDLEEEHSADTSISNSIRFIKNSLETQSQQELASRLTLNCSNDYVQPQRLRGIPVMILDVLDSSALSQSMKDELVKCYPDAKLAQLKSGGNFPYLSRPTEVNVFIQIHLSQFTNTRYSALTEKGELAKLYRTAHTGFPSQ